MFERGYREFFGYLVLLAQCPCSCVRDVHVFLLASFRILTFGRAVHGRRGSLVVTLDQQDLPALPYGE